MLDKFLRQSTPCQPLSWISHFCTFGMVYWRGQHNSSAVKIGTDLNLGSNPSLVVACEGSLSLWDSYFLISESNVHTPAFVVQYKDGEYQVPVWQRQRSWNPVPVNGWRAKGSMSWVGGRSSVLLPSLDAVHTDGITIRWRKAVHSHRALWKQETNLALSLDFRVYFLLHHHLGTA